LPFKIWGRQTPECVLPPYFLGIGSGTHRSSACSAFEIPRDKLFLKKEQKKDIILQPQGRKRGSQKNCLARIAFLKARSKALFLVKSF